MNNLKFFFVLFFASTISIYGQEIKFSDEISTYLEVNESLNQYDYAYDQLLQMLEKQFTKSPNNTEGWNFLESNKEDALAEMKDLLIPIYQRNFSQAEIRKMSLFYSSATGKQLIDDRSQMTDAQKTELNSFYNSDLGKKISAKQPILIQEIVAASEEWSRDLYETAVSLIKD